MTRRPSPLRALAVALLAFAVAPAVAFGVFEWRLARASEAALAETRDAQLDALLQSVNEHAWRTADAWASRLAAVPGLTAPGDDYAITYETWEGIRAILEGTPAVDAVLSFDTTLATGGPATLRQDGDEMTDAFRQAYSAARVRRLVERHAVGYRQLDPVPLPGGRLALAFLAVDPAADGPPRVVALVVAPGRFVESVVMPKLRELARGGLVLGVFVADGGEAAPDAATGPLTWETVERSRPLWILPAHAVGARPSDASAEAVGRRRRWQALGLLASVTLVLGLGGVVAWRAVRREVEVARLREGFVSNVSHELRTPLAMIRLSAETLAAGRAPEARRAAYLATIVAEAERLTRLINNVLLFNQPEAGPERRPVDVGALAGEVGERYRPVLAEAGVQLTVDAAPGTQVLADPDALAEALVNLLDNAGKYGSAGGEAALTVRVCDGAAGRQAVIDVTDRGPGLAATDRARVFEPFVRVQATSADGLAHTAKGTGLGLALVRRIAESHGGTVAAHERPDGPGALFRLTLPALAERPPDA